MRRIVLFVVLLLSFCGFSQESQLFTEDLLNLGIKEINVIKTESGINYELKSYKSFYYLNLKSNLSDFKFSLNEKTKELSLFDTYKIVSQNGNYMITTPKYKGELKGVPQEYLNDYKLGILLLFFNEINTSDDSKTTYEKYYASKINYGGCAFFDTYYSIGAGLTEAAAQSSLYYYMNEAIRNGEFEGCRKMGAVGTSTIGGYLHTAIQAWCCP